LPLRPPHPSPPRPRRRPHRSSRTATAARAAVTPAPAAAPGADSDRGARRVQRPFGGSGHPRPARPASLSSPDRRGGTEGGVMATVGDRRETGGMLEFRGPAYRLGRPLPLLPATFHLLGTRTTGPTGP